MPKSKAQTVESMVVKRLYFSSPVIAERLSVLVEKLESAKASGKVNNEDWGYLTITEVYQACLNHQHYLLFWEACITDMTAFNRFKLKEPKNYGSLRRLMEDEKYPKTPSSVDPNEYQQAATYVTDFLYANLSKSTEKL